LAFTKNGRKVDPNIRARVSFGGALTKSGKESPRGGLATKKLINKTRESFQRRGCWMRLRTDGRRPDEVESGQYHLRDFRVGVPNEEGEEVRKPARKVGHNE